MSAGTGFTLIHNWLNRGGLAHRTVTGGPQSLTDALLKAVRANGGEIRTGADVTQILVENQRVLGVRLASGEEINAATSYRRPIAPHAAGPGWRPGTAA